MMLTFDEITLRETDFGLCTLQFDFFPGKVLVIDWYCVKPFCDCASVGLEFWRLDDDEQIKGMLFYIQLDTSDWHVTEEHYLSRGKETKQMWAEFFGGMDNDMKSVLASRAKRAKEYGRDHPFAFIKPEMLKDGDCFNYAEVYGPKDDEVFPFIYKDIQYWVDEQYCLNPACHCNEVVLAFYRIRPERRIQEAEFTIRLRLNDYQYSVEERPKIED